MIEITWVEIILATWLLGTLAFSVGYCLRHYHRLRNHPPGLSLKPPYLKPNGFPMLTLDRLPSEPPMVPEKTRRRYYIALLAALASLASLFHAHPAHAIPSFSRQTSMACSSCHTSSFGPNLTPFGRKFKLDGYTQGSDDSQGPMTRGIPPLSGMLMGSFTNTQKNQEPQPTTGPSSPRFDSNNNFAMDQASFFYGGRVYGSIGAFAQFTYDGVANIVAVDNIDLRFARGTDILGHQFDYGISLNNSPTVSDLWNTTPAWGFPFATSPIAPSPGAGPLISGALAQQVGGGSVYAMIDNFLYLEAGAYGDFSVSAQKNMGVWDPGNALLNGGAPYWRVELQHSWDKQYVGLGTFGLDTTTYADRFNKGSGTNQYTDLGMDLTYQYLGTMEHIFEFRASYIREHQSLNGSQAMGAVAKSNLMLNTLNLNGSYTFQQTYVGNLGFFDISGSTDPLLYADYTSYRPASQGFIAELDYIPFGKSYGLAESFMNLRLAVQYVGYTQFDGANKAAGNNNTLFVSGWLAF